MTRDQHADLLEDLTRALTALTGAHNSIPEPMSYALIEAHVILSSAVQTLEDIEPIEICSYTGRVLHNAD